MFHHEGAVKPDVFKSAQLKDGEVLHGFSSRRIGVELPAHLMPLPVVRLNQIHGNRVLEVDRAFDQLPPQEVLRYDACITNRNDVALSVRTADCVPILLYSPERKAVAAIHAGWRGTLAQIVTQTVDALTHTYGCRSSDLLACIGPCIHPCCYQVGTEVFEPMKKRFGAGVAQIQNKDLVVDLVQANRQLLFESGVLRQQVDCVDYCTSCNQDLFYSYRRDSTAAGRQLAFIGLI